MRKFIVIFTLTPLLFLCNQAIGAQMAIWNFGPNAAGFTTTVTAENVIGTPTLIAGGGDYDADGKDGVAYLDSESVSHIAGQALAWNDPTTKSGDGGIIIAINTTDYYDINFRWDYWSENSGSKVGPDSLDFDYSIDSGINWVEVLNNASIVRNEAWNVFSLDLSSIAVIENQSSIQFRINDFDDKINGVGDIFQMDNIEITGVPEPATFILLVVGGSCILRKKRERLF